MFWRAVREAGEAEGGGGGEEVLDEGAVGHNEGVGAGIGGWGSGCGEVSVEEVAHLDEPCGAAGPCVAVGEEVLGGAEVG